MAGNIIGEPISRIIGEQVDLRQRIHGAGYNESSLQRSPTVLNFLNNKNAWIKLASGVSLDNITGKDRLKALSEEETSGYFTDNDISSLLGSNLAKNYILFNTMQSLTQRANRSPDGNNTPAIYGERSGIRTTNSWGGSNGKMYGGMGGNSRGLQPVPGITGIKVESVNRGSIRKATVTLKAFNKFQFGIIEILYLKLGYLMMLEWGWDKYIDSIDENNNPIIKNVESTIIENDWFKDGYVDQPTMLGNINSFVKRYRGNYQGFFGKVNNFSWALNADNTYDITVNLITLGSVIESVNAVVPSSPLTTREIKQRTKDLRKAYKIKTDDEGGLEEGETDNKVITNLGSDRISSFIAEKIRLFFSDSIYINNKDYYAFVDAIYLNPALYTNVDGGFKEYISLKVPPSCRYYIRFEELLDVIEKNVILKIKSPDSKSPPTPTITFLREEESTRINYEPNLVPLDPSICIFKPVFTDELGITKTINLPTFSELEDFVVEKDNVYYGKLMNVYLNLDYVSTVLNTNKNEKNELNLYNFIQKLLNGINRCMGNIPDLTLSIKDDRTLYFLDENPISGYESAYPPKNKEVEFNVIGYTPNSGSSFITNFNFQTKITPKLMTQISIGAAANGTSVGYKNWNQGLINRFENEYEETPPPTLSPSAKAGKYYDDLYKEFREDATEVMVGDYYKWEYKGIWHDYGTDYTDIEAQRSFGNSRKENMDDVFLFAQVKKKIKEIDSYVSQQKEQQKDNETDKGINDYSSYLLDGFGGTGTNIVQTISPNWDVNNNNISSNSKLKQENYNKYQTLKSRISNGIATSAEIFDAKYEFKKRQINPKKSLYWYASDNKEFMERGYNSFKRYKSSLDKNQYENFSTVSGATGFIPVTLGLTFEGLGGIKIYNQIKVNQNSLPASYPKALQFVVDGVNHEVKGNLWKTNITTISRPNTNTPIKIKGVCPSETSTNTSSTGTKWEAGADVYIPSNNRVSYLSDITKQTRPLPVQKQLMDILAEAAEECDVYIKISSAGNVPRPQRTNSLLTGDGVDTVNSLGSNRHDNGFAADFGIFYEGKRLNVAESVAPKAMEFLKAIRRLGVQSIGTGKNYMRGISVHADIAGGNSRTGTIYTCFTAGGQTNPISSWLPKFMAETRTALNAPSGTYGGVKLIFNDRYA